MSLPRCAGGIYNCTMVQYGRMKGDRGILRLAVPVAALILCAAIFLTPQQANREARDTIYQVSTIGALMRGDYDGQTEVSVVRRHGGSGLGTFDRLDGELVALDGVFYRVGINGSVAAVPDSARTPFVMVTSFEADTTYQVDRPLDYAALCALIDRLAPNKNMPYTVKVAGFFSKVTARSVSPQEKPYRPLTEAVKEQAIFTFSGISGTLIGFRMPSYMDGVTVPGYHFHFLSDDRKAGGHVLGCTIDRGTVALDETNGFSVLLPRSESFAALDLSAGRPDDLDKVEKLTGK